MERSSRSNDVSFFRFSFCLRGLLATAGLALGLTSTSLYANETEEDASFSSETSRAPVINQYFPETTTSGELAISASFRNFDSQALNVKFKLDAAASRESLREFGVSENELDDLMRACMAAKDCDQAEFDRWTTRYYREHALRFRQEAGQRAKISVDVAEVVRRNRARVRPVALALRQIAEQRGYSREWTLEAAVAMVQSGLIYKQPKAAEYGRRILGFYPPPLALERGYGDCDTKAALLAAILQNLTKTQIIGVHVPKHYLLGIAGTPREGQASIRYQNQTYVLIEAAGPGQRRPGQVAKTTQLALDASQGIRVDPMF